MATSNQQDVLQTMGGCGKFQVMLTMTVHSGSMLAAWGMLFMAYGMYNPGWMCLDDRAGNVSNMLNKTEFQHSAMLSWTSKNTSEGQKAVGNTEWTTSCDVKKMCQNISYHPDSTIIKEWGLSCELSWVPSVIISIQMAGVLMGSYVGGQIGDRFGRKVSLYSHVAFLGVCHLLVIFSVSWQMFTAILCFIGFNAGGILAITFHYPMEFVSEKWRGVIASLPIWNIGCTFFAVSVFLLRDWRHMNILATVISFVIFLTVFWTPESTRWLAVSGKTDKAKRVVAKVARMNSRPCPDTQIIDDIALEEKTQMKGHKYTYMDLFRIAAIRLYSIKFGIIWTNMSITYYTISFGIRSLSGNFYLNFLIFSIFEFPGMLFVAPAVNKLGRRKAGMVYFSVELMCAVSVVIVSFCATGSTKNMCILILALTCKLLIVSVWSVVGIHSGELFPTVVRSIHYGYLNAVSRVGGMISPYLISNEPDNLYVAFIVLAVLMSVNLILVWSVPETKGRALQDRAQNVHCNLEGKPMCEIQRMNVMETKIYPHQASKE